MASRSDMPVGYWRKVTFPEIHATVKSVYTGAPEPHVLINIDDDRLMDDLKRAARTEWLGDLPDAMKVAIGNYFMVVQDLVPLFERYARTDGWDGGDDAWEPIQDLVREVHEATLQEIRTRVASQPLAQAAPTVETPPPHALFPDTYREYVLTYGTIVDPFEAGAP